MPILDFLGLSDRYMPDVGDATDRQTSDAHHRLMPVDAYPRGIINVFRMKYCLILPK